MKTILQNLFEQVKSSTDSQEILVAFEDVFNNEHETINSALKQVEMKSIQDSLDTGTVLLITKALREALGDEVINRDLFITYLDGVAIDIRFVDIKFLEECIQDIGFNPKSSHYYLYKTETYFATEKDIKRFIGKTFNQSSITVKVAEYHKGDVEGYKKNVLNFVVNKIRDNNQYLGIRYESNPFSEDSRVEFKQQIMTITFNDLFPVVPEVHEDDLIVADYKEHFKDLDVFLDFLLVSRFGADRKKSYMWFRAQSDWGKSWLFQGVLGGLKLATTITESELKKSYSGGASGFTADMFTHSWFLFIDEFKSAVSEIKNITHELSFSPKFQGQVTVPLYAKIFSSAENVRSLNNDGMVESQFSNRFIFWTEKGELTSRALYSNNQLLYTKVIMSYVYDYLKTQADIYISMGEIEASNKANQVLNEIIKAKEVETISVEEVLSERIDEFKEAYQDIFELRDQYFTCEGYIYIKHKGKFIDVFLDTYFSDDEIKIIRHKEQNVILGITDSKRESKRVGGALMSGYKWKSIIHVVQNLKEAPFEFDFDLGEVS